MDRFTLLLLAGICGCARWQHAPGHDTRQSMQKLELRVATGRFCHFGACDKVGLYGRFRFSNIDFLVANEVRTRTRFDIEHAGAHARCRQHDDPDRPFACTILAAGERHELSLHGGCTTGLARGGPRPLSIQTDEVAIAGRVVPGREVALLDDDGVVMFADARAPDNLDLFTRPGVPPNAQLLMVVAVHAFLGLDGSPRGCGV